MRSCCCAFIPSPQVVFLICCITITARLFTVPSDQLTNQYTLWIKGVLPSVKTLLCRIHLCFLPLSSLLSPRLLQVHLRDWKILHDGGGRSVSRSWRREDMRKHRISIMKGTLNQSTMRCTWPGRKG